MLPQWTGCLSYLNLSDLPHSLSIINQWVLRSHPSLSCCQSTAMTVGVLEHIHQPFTEPLLSSRDCGKAWKNSNKQDKHLGFEELVFQCR